MAPTLSARTCAQWASGKTKPKFPALTFYISIHVGMRSAPFSGHTLATRWPQTKTRRDGSPAHLVITLNVSPRDQCARTRLISIWADRPAPAAAPVAAAHRRRDVDTEAATTAPTTTAATRPAATAAPTAASATTATATTATAARFSRCRCCGQQYCRCADEADTINCHQGHRSQRTCKEAAGLTCLLSHS
jgi:hypothetical protein